MEMTDLTPDKIEEMRKVWNESEKRFTPLINCPLCPEPKLKQNRQSLEDYYDNLGDTVLEDENGND